jgi:rRNA processing protein Gar1
MTLNQLASKIAKLEGKKSQARVGDIREILGIISDVFYQTFSEDQLKGEVLVETFVQSGARREKRTARAKRVKK